MHTDASVKTTNGACLTVRDSAAGENKQDTMNAVFKEQEEATAYHEAGHAAIGCVLGRKLKRVTIIPDGKGVVGSTEFANGYPETFARTFNQSKAKRQYVEDRVAGELAGSLAQSRKVPGRDRDAGDEHDDYQARELSRELVGETPSETDRLREQCLANGRARAKALLEQHWPWVEAVATALIQRKELSGDEVLALRPS
jgi:ATP-dependent Zn protease